MRKMRRSEHLTFLDITPEDTATFKKLGWGITDLAIAYNPNIESEKFIIEDVARHDHTSNEKTASVSQSIYVDEPCYEFVRKGLDELNYTTHILTVDTTHKKGEAYEATLSDGLIAITSYMGENAVIEYDLYWEGNAKKGTVTIDKGVPTFIPDETSDVE